MLKEFETALLALPAAMLVLVTTAARSLLIERHHGWAGFWTNLAAAVATSLLVANALEAMTLANGMRVVAIGLSAFLAPDILLWARATFQALGPELTARVRTMLGGKND